MPWPKEHKARTRRRIVEAASAAFRDAGIAGVRVEDVMARAGLTHGGFYAHFDSKDDLVREAVEHAGEQTVEMLSKPVASVPEGDRLSAMVDAYLSPAHAAHPEKGCPLASLGSELARTGGAAQRTLAAGVRGRLEWMRQLLPDDERGTMSEEQLIGTLACMVGGIILARATGGSGAPAILDACRAYIHERTSMDHTKRPASRPRVKPVPSSAPRAARKRRQSR